jgi:hypothetical protein
MVKSKPFSPHAMKAYRGSEGVSPLILNLGTRRTASDANKFNLGERAVAHL